MLRPQASSKQDNGRDSEVETAETVDVLAWFEEESSHLGAAASLEKARMRVSQSLMDDS